MGCFLQFSAAWGTPWQPFIPLLQRHFQIRRQALQRGGGAAENTEEFDVAHGSWFI
jgi:hypothetical protein